MFTLGVETSTQSGSLSLFENRSLVSTRNWSRTGSHSEFLNSNLVELLAFRNITVHDLNRLAIGIGPGSFTGIRVGINFIRALAYSLSIPVYPINSLHLLASQKNTNSSAQFRVVQYAFRNLLYTALYKLDHGRVIEVDPPRALTIDEILTLYTEPTITLGSGSEMLLSACNTNNRHLLVRKSDLSDEPCAEFFMQTPALDESPSALTDWIHTIPLYVRASEAEEKLRTSINKS